MAAPGTTGSHSTSSGVIRSFMAQPHDVIRSRLVAAPGTTGSHSTSSRVIRSFMAQPHDVIRSIRSSYSSNNVYLLDDIKRSLNELSSFQHYVSNAEPHYNIT